MLSFANARRQLLDFVTRGYLMVMCCPSIIISPNRTIFKWQRVRPHRPVTRGSPSHIWKYRGKTACRNQWSYCQTLGAVFSVGGGDNCNGIETDKAVFFGLLTANYLRLTTLQMPGESAMRIGGRPITNHENY